MNQRIFREYDIRGIADRDLTTDVVENIGKAIGTYAKNKGAKVFTVGRDCRLSSPRIHEALCTALQSTGINIIDIGLVPTPLLYFSVFELKSEGGIMITGSHNPAEHNGFKVCVGKTTLHGNEIQELKKIIESRKFSVGSGSIKSQSIIDQYIKRVVSDIKHPLNLNIVVDSGNGMGSVVAGNLFRQLGCTVTELFSELDGRFPNHHPDPTVLENMKDLVATVKKQKASVGIAFDGDADRIGAIDPSGQQIFGDELLVLYARDILEKSKGAKIISEVKASHRLYNDVSKHGGVPIMWKTGHSLIKAKMKEEGALLAGEMSGHMFFNDRYFGYDDAIYAAARLLEILAHHGKSPSQLLSDLPRSYSTPEIRVDCPDEVKFDVVSKAKAQFLSMGLTVNGIDGARVEFKDGWGLVRASNTQPVLVFRFEATTDARLKEIQTSIEGVVQKIIANAL